MQSVERVDDALAAHGSLLPREEDLSNERVGKRAIDHDYLPPGSMWLSSQCVLGNGTVIEGAPADGGRGAAYPWKLPGKIPPRNMSQPRCLRWSGPTRHWPAFRPSAVLMRKRRSTSAL